jgi:ATP-dependent helicase/nuclease subunit B
VIVRSLETCHATLARVFQRYGLPLFLDRRESVSHHPLAELTRFAARTVAFGWRHDDWFGALKSGLGPIPEHDLDWLENVALQFGWQGGVWRQPITMPTKEMLAERAERLRQRIVPPFADLAQQAAAPLTGPQLAGALRELWIQLRVEESLEHWNETAGSEVHSTVWEQMNDWLENLALAFARESLALREWLPILEAGLANLTIGVVPPALDQVLIGAIDRSRNPDLKLALVLGLNEGLFPAPPAAGTLLTDADRRSLEREQIYLGPTQLQRLGLHPGQRTARAHARHAQPRRPTVESVAAAGAHPAAHRSGGRKVQRAWGLAGIRTPPRVGVAGPAGSGLASFPRCVVR